LWIGLSVATFGILTAHKINSWSLICLVTYLYLLPNKHLKIEGTITTMA